METFVLEKGGDLGQLTKQDLTNGTIEYDVPGKEATSPKHKKNGIQDTEKASPSSIGNLKEPEFKYSQEAHVTLDDENLLVFF